jgi:hypothetical protein
MFKSPSLAFFFLLPRLWLVPIAGLLWAATLAGCTTFSPSITPLTPTPYPDFISAVHPEPGETLSVVSYASLPTHETFEKDGTEYIIVEHDPPFSPVEEVCVWLNHEALASSSNFLFTWIPATPATTPQVDEQASRNDTLASYTKLWVDGQPTAVYEFMEPLLGGIYFQERDAQGNLIREYDLFTGVCAAAPLSAGVHRVDLSFEKSSGEVVSYSWTFQLVDE